MTEAKHTPGPWHISPYGVGFEIDAANGQSIAQAQQIAQTKKPEDHNERKANARLISAAPELLDASMKVLEWFEAEDDHSKADFYQRMQMCRDAEEMIRAAIAKATGN